MRKNILLIISVLVFLLICNLAPNVNGETFNIGNKIQSDIVETYSSGAYGYASEPDNVTEILDGNLSTGISYKFPYNISALYYEFFFSDHLYVNNITVKPRFGGIESNYSLVMILNNDYKIYRQWYDGEKTFHTNVTMIGFELWIHPSSNWASNEIHFNDLIINYTPMSSSNIPNYQQHINQINHKLNSMQNDIIVLKNDIIDIKENITNIKKDMPSEYNDSALQDQINNLTQELNSLKENLTKINNSIPMEYNDSEIKSNIFSVETENIFLKQQIGNLTVRINNLTTELEKISSEVQNLQSVSNTGDKTKDSESYQYMNTLIFGVIIIVLLLIILKLSLTVLKRKHHDSEEPRSDDILISKIKHDILTNKEIKDTRLYDEEYKNILENGYRKGEMSQETYNYIKTVLEVSEKPQKLKNKKTEI